MRFPYIALMILACTSVACDKPAAAPQPVSSSVVIDSVFPIEEEIRRFTKLYGTVASASLRSGELSRDRLVRRFMRALESEDSTDLRRMTIGADEFIGSYYPASHYARPPYRQSPAFVWFQFQANSSKGLMRALQRFAGRPPGAWSYQCDPLPVKQGSTKQWNDCRITWEHHPRTLRLFGTIIEIDGRFKFVSYANDL